MMMSMIISGPHQPGIDIDMYLRLLVDDLKTLWSKGVQVYDAYKRVPFTLRGLLFTTITDIPGGHYVSRQLQHTVEVSPYIDEHKEHLREVNPGRSEIWLAKAHMSGFNI